jgi:hypothetical protein
MARALVVGVDVRECVCHKTLGFMRFLREKVLESTQKAAFHEARACVNENYVVTVSNQVRINNVRRKARDLPNVWGYEAHSCLL